MKTKRAAILARVSTNSQDTLRQTIELQELAKNQGYLVEKDDIYEDTISGLKRYQDRPALSRLFDNIKKGRKRYDMVYVHEVSRISRRFDDGQKILLEFSDLGIPVYIKNINQCTLNENGTRNQYFNIIVTLLQEFAASELEYIRERSMSGARQKVKLGGAGSGVFLAYGYKRDEKKMLAIDSDEAEVIKSIFEYARKGMGLKTICSILNESGIPTKSQKVIKKGTIETKGSGTSKRVKETKHIRWEEGTVQTIITNTIYKGERRYKDLVVESPVIIEPGLFDQVQKLRREKYDKRSREQRYLYLLKDICTCGVCGRNMVGRFKPGTDMYYQCSSKRHAHLNCGNISPNIEALESTCWDVIRDSYRTIKHLENNENKMTEAINKKAILEADLKFMITSMVEAEAERERVKTMFKRGIISEDEMVSDFDKLDKQVKTKQGNIQRLKKQIQAVAESMVMMANMDRLMAWARRKNLSRFEIAEVMNNVFERVTVTSVNKHRNNNRWIVSIWLKDMVRPFTLLMETKQRNHNIDFMLPEFIDESGQNRFKYVELADYLLEDVEYNKEGQLVTSTEEVVEMILNQNPEDYVIYPGAKLQQETEGANLFFVNHRPEGFDYGFWTEIIPRLVPFEEVNSVENVQKIKLKQKELKEKKSIKEWVGEI